MQLHLNRHKFAILFILIPVIFSSLEYNYKKFYFNFNKNLPSEILGRITDALDKSEDFFYNNFNFLPNARLDFYFFENIELMKKKLDVQPWIGGYYANGTVYLQPPDILIKKNMLEKVLFTEYAHYYINELSGYACPLWLNEMLSYSYCNNFSNAGVSLNKNIKIIDKFNDFINIKKLFNDYNYAREFYYNSEMFFYYLNHNESNDFFNRLLRNLKEKKDIDASFKELAGDGIEKIYNEYVEFIKAK
jgi:hypothetical protein